MLDVAHAVVDEQHLTLAQHLAPDRFRRGARVVLTDVREDRLAVFGRRLHERQVADAGERHLERARDRRGREREHVDVGAHLLDAFLVLHAEPLLFVDDEQPEVLELDVLGEQAVRPDDDVDLAFLRRPGRPRSAPSRSGTARAPRRAPDSSRTARGTSARAGSRAASWARAPRPACRRTPPWPRRAARPRSCRSRRRRRSSRSIGIGRSMSALVSSIALS